MRHLFRIALILAVAMLLMGCSGRELEDRDFPSVLLISTEGVEGSQQKENSKYLDYSHTKAVIFEEPLFQEPEQLEQAVEYLKENPEFARNMLIFAGDSEVLKLAEEKNSEIGNELQDYYKNQPRDQQVSAVTLADLINFFHNKEESLTIPTLKVSGEKLFPKGTVKLNNEL